MKLKCYIVPFLLLLSILCNAQKNGVELLKKHFTSEQAKTAKLSSDVDFMTTEEKQFIFYMNLCRLYPRQFADFYLDYLQEYDEYGYQKLKKKDQYYYSLLKDLNKQKPLKALAASKEMYELAKCWAIESGKKGVIGHNRKKCKKGYNAECCSYNNSTDLLEFLFNLMVDEGVPSLGHREAILGNYKKAGASIQKHKTYGYCIVIDFSY
ncbi:MAG: hypothetical protein KDD29_00390 [Flavobacteriales bacterium]|nr:hypothetical protein [Flavobacteriales bacterium]MCB9336220.1 hypothetical protein [Flavobacteriales bacterium]